MSIPQRIDPKTIHEGIAFSAPVFFEDGENMFLAANRPAKRYHVAAIKRWRVPYLLCAGTEVNLEELNRRTVKAEQSGTTSVSLSAFDGDGDLEELEELEEL